MVTEKTQALLTVLRELVEYMAQKTVDGAVHEKTYELMRRASIIEAITDMMTNILAANSMEQEGIARFAEAKLSADASKN